MPAPRDAARRPTAPGSARRPGRPQISLEIIALIIAAHETGQSLRQIARSVGVSHQTAANAIRPPARKPTPRKTKAHETELTAPQRCAEGHLCTILPCRTCAARAHFARSRARRARLAQRVHVDAA